MFISVTTSSILIESSNFCLSLHHTCNDTVSWIFKKNTKLSKSEVSTKGHKKFQKQPLQNSQENNCSRASFY